MIWLFLNFLILIIFILLFLVTRQENKKRIKINDYLNKVTNTVNSVRYGNLSAKLDNVNHPNYTNLTKSVNRMVETLYDREKMIDEYQTELMKQNKLLESVINSLSDGILIINDKHTILRATPHINDWFKVKGKELIGKNISDYISLKENTSVEQAKNSEILIKETPTNNFVMNTLKLPLDEEKKRYVILIKDITTEKEIETLKEDFVATLTHDLKVPIVAECNIINFLLEGKFGKINDKQQVALLNMKKSNQELIEFVQIILDTYKIKEKNIRLFKENVMLNKFISDIIKEIRPITNGIKINFRPSRDIKVTADTLQLSRVIKNLISNAISHSNTKDKIDIITGEIPGYITISVIDYGQGIPKDEIKFIFNKYYSVSKKFRKIGTGLGLYLSQQIIKSHGGEISVKSEENVRTEFCIKLPLL